jgi:hypothetical protein
MSSISRKFSGARDNTAREERNWGEMQMLAGLSLKASQSLSASRQNFSETLSKNGRVVRHIATLH